MKNNKPVDDVFRGDYQPDYIGDDIGVPEESDKIYYDGDIVDISEIMTRLCDETPVDFSDISKQNRALCSNFFGDDYYY